MTTITQVISTLPTAPARSQAPATFITNADAHVAALSTLTSEVNTWRGQANTVAGEVNANAVAAAADAVDTAADAIATAADRVQTGIDASAASASAAAAASSASGFVGTSTTSLLIGTGSKTFTTQASEQYTAGIWVTASSAANPNNYMYGQVTSYSSTTLIVNVTKTGGSGTLADWNISLAGVQGEAGTGITPETVGWTGTGGTTPKTLTVDADLTTSNFQTTSSPEFAALNIGHASDTTLTRVSAGKLAQEGVTLADLGAQSFTGQQTFKEVKDTVYTITDGAAFEIDPVNGSVQLVTLGASRTPAATNFEAGQTVLLGIDDGTAYSVTWTTVAPTWVTPGGTAAAPTLAASGYTWILMTKIGSTIFASEWGQP